MENMVEFNVLDTICEIAKKANKSHFKTELLKGSIAKIKRLGKYLNASDTETLLFVAIYSENYSNRGCPDIETLSRFFDVEPLAILQKKAELQNLIESNIIDVVVDYNPRNTSWNRRNRRRSRGLPFAEDEFSINSVVAEAILDNRSLVEIRENEEQMSNTEFVEIVSNIVENTERGAYAFSKMLDKISAVEKSLEKLPVIKKTAQFLSNIEDRTLFYLICHGSTDSRYGVSLKDALEVMYTNMRKRIEMANMCRNKEHPIFVKELICFVEKEEDFDLLVELDDKGLDLFLDEYTKLFQNKNNSKNFLGAEKINEKKLFFPQSLEKQVNFLKTNLEQEKFVALQARLKKEKMPQGLCALFYGSPGTGKTETVFQLAKATGRGIIHVDISQSKSCWFGESEKRIKKIFQDYRRSCKNSDLMPILLFNEADAIFSKRKDTDKSNVAQTENAIQNIILEEMENLDGILIATTNLTGNFDSAFERRFLFKIEFEKPSIEAKQHIWQDKLSFLSQEDSQTLANQFDFSGGEIDNIVRKCIMNDVISGKTATLSDITALCQQERIAKDTAHRTIGFYK